VIAAGIIVSLRTTDGSTTPDSLATRCDRNYGMQRNPMSRRRPCDADLTGLMAHTWRLRREPAVDDWPADSSAWQALHRK
jgi:hypothetical protein